VLLHAGAVAYSPAIGYLVMKPNVFADISQQTWMDSPQHLATSLRYWLEWYPEKILFGTDLYPGTPEIDWEEVGWQFSQVCGVCLESIDLCLHVPLPRVFRREECGLVRLECIVC
jgi:hypothetical protein